MTENGEIFSTLIPGASRVAARWAHAKAATAPAQPKRTATLEAAPKPKRKYCRKAAPVPAPTPAEDPAPAVIPPGTLPTAEPAPARSEVTPEPDAPSGRIDVPDLAPKAAAAAPRNSKEEANIAEGFTRTARTVSEFERRVLGMAIAASNLEYVHALTRLLELVEKPERQKLVDFLITPNVLQHQRYDKL